MTETGSFIQYLTPSFETTQITKCQILFNGTTLNLTLSKATLATNDEEEDTHILKRLFSLGRGLCGFKLINVTTDDPREYTFIATDSQNNDYKTTFTVSILCKLHQKKCSVFNSFFL